MPTQNLAVPYQEFLNQDSRHGQIVAALPAIEPRLQKLLAELILMRSFDEFQTAIAGIACRLACGTNYVDGTAPQLLVSRARSTAGAIDLFENHGRQRRRYVKWSKVSYINETTEYVIDRSDPLLVACSSGSVVISEMQAVRNRIAHANSSSRANYAGVIRRHYGAALNNVSPGLFLLSPRFTPTKLEEYLTSCRVVLKQSVRA